ncbi:MAG TPA: MFS transporter, partial [Candidatus Wallbacteria bacterium]|nr:MFS transporter [Candidatus Wallbacteria bacterium]
MSYITDKISYFFKNLFRAFKSRNYRLFFFGHGVSLIGTWMQQVALSWYVYRITGSSFLLGFTGFMGYIPSFFLTPVSGVLADRFNRHRLLVLTQICAMIQASSLAYAVYRFNGEVWRAILLTFTLGVINSFDAPIR